MMIRIGKRLLVKKDEIKSLTKKGVTQIATKIGETSWETTFTSEDERDEEFTRLEVELVK